MKTKKKRSVPRRILRTVGIVCLCVVLLLAGMIGFLSATEYRPSDTEALAIDGSASAVPQIGVPLTVVSWNIGYGALGDNADFFMDGGTMVRTADKARIEQNLADVASQIETMQPDVLLLQEVDRNSARSEHIDAFARFSQTLTGYAASFANNFKISFLPYPIPPIGKVDSGIATFSAFRTTRAERVQLPIPFSWPMRMANLKRCLLVSRIPVAGSGKELVVVNLHLEAYDDGEGKRAQTAMLAELLSAEAAKGNYVIAGGDFNQFFSSADTSAFPTYDGNWQAGAIDETQFEGEWQFLMDESVPSCRSLYKVYAGADKDTFQYYVIDGFIVSGNIAVQSFAAQDLGFTASDHNPVRMQITLL